MNWYEDEIRQLEKKIQTQSPDNKPVVFYGSSSIRLWDKLTEDFPLCTSLNLGFGGSTLAACTWFFERVVVPARPSSLILYAGDNDLGDNRHPEEVYLFFCAFSDKVQQYFPAIPFTYLSVKASPARWHNAGNIRRTNDLIRGKTGEFPNYFFVDMFTPMLNDAGQPRRELFEADGLHLNRKGYELWRDVLTQHPHIFS
ncbi:SGNH/GDSL hydrolase family protein [Nibrella saemangeumensis]|uniref:SGNH/GDSL hydrolase family protein n=1 Tax=Nibrella saemangeumensis TaxID=1084526 RepID=A0ABP8N245_9BACT